MSDIDVTHTIDKHELNTGDLLTFVSREITLWNSLVLGKELLVVSLTKRTPLLLLTVDHDTRGRDFALVLTSTGKLGWTALSALKKL